MIIYDDSRMSGEDEQERTRYVKYRLYIACNYEM